MSFIFHGPDVYPAPTHAVCIQVIIRHGLQKGLHNTRWVEAATSPHDPFSIKQGTCIVKNNCDCHRRALPLLGAACWNRHGHYNIHAKPPAPATAVPFKEIDWAVFFLKSNVANALISNAIARHPRQQKKLSTPHLEKKLNGHPIQGLSQKSMKTVS